MSSSWLWTLAKPSIQSAMPCYYKRSLCLIFQMLYTGRLVLVEKALCVIWWLIIISNAAISTSIIQGPAVGPVSHKCWWHAAISTSIIQGPAVGPVSHKRWWHVAGGNRIHKYADDMYVVIPATNVQYSKAEPCCSMGSAQLPQTKEISKIGWSHLQWQT